jgi:diketogulonate reductase-like aldo/keto reductase
LIDGSLALPALNQVAHACQRTPAQVLLRWAIQHGASVIPKSLSPKRIIDNAEALAFTLSDEQMHALDTLAATAQLPMRRFCWDPTSVV